MRLHELRDASGLTVDDVDEKLECSASKINRMETGSRQATRVTCAVCASSTDWPIRRRSTTSSSWPGAWLVESV
jgi:hypothetical protein